MENLGAEDSATFKVRWSHIHTWARRAGEGVSTIHARKKFLREIAYFWPRRSIFSDFVEWGGVRPKVDFGGGGPYRGRRG